MIAKIYIGVERFYYEPDYDDNLAHFDKRVCDIAGGFTRYNAQGGWKGSDGKYWLEDSIVYEVATDIDNARLVAKHAKSFFEQEAVLLMVIQAESELI